MSAIYFLVRTVSLVVVDNSLRLGRSRIVTLQDGDYGKRKSARPLRAFSANIPLANRSDCCRSYSGVIVNKSRGRILMDWFDISRYIKSDAAWVFEGTSHRRGRRRLCRGARQEEHGR